MARRRAAAASGRATAARLRAAAAQLRAAAAQSRADAPGPDFADAVRIVIFRRLVCLTALTLLACSPPEGLSSTAAAPAEETRPAAAPRVPLTVRETAG